MQEFPQWQRKPLNYKTMIQIYGSRFHCLFKLLSYFTTVANTNQSVWFLLRFPSQHFWKLALVPIFKDAVMEFRGVLNPTDKDRPRNVREENHTSGVPSNNSQLQNIEDFIMVVMDGKCADFPRAVVSQSQSNLRLSFLLPTFTQDVETLTLFHWKYLQKKAKQKTPAKENTA